MVTNGTSNSSNAALANIFRDRSSLSGEQEQKLGSTQVPTQEKGLKDLAQAFLNTGGTTAPTELSRISPQDERQEAERMRTLQQHIEINQANPVDNHVLFAGRAKEVQAQLKSTRSELSLLYKRKPVQDKSIETAVFSEITVQGIEDGAGQKNFFLNVQQAILRKQHQAHLTETWLREEAARRAKKLRAQGGGESAPRGSHQETAKVHADFENPEDNLAKQGA
jgi:hypothetical protein